jgi:hypothetical protein
LRLDKGGGVWRQGHQHGDGTDVETAARSAGCDQVTRKVRIENQQGQEHAIEVTVYGWKVLLLIDAAAKIPLAVKVGPIDEHATH